MTTADAIRQAGDRCVVLLRVREGRAANDNDCARCREARRRGGYVCPLCAGRGVLW